MVQGKKPVDIEELKRLNTDKGSSLRQIGEKFGITGQAVYDRLKKTGITMRPKTPLPLDISRSELYDL